MKRFVAVVAVVAVVAAPRLALAGTRQATVGNYYFEDDQQRDRSKITVRQGDQITFTVRQAAYPPHTVDVDALDIHSGDLFVGQTFTTPALMKAGTFYLYCRPHEARGHHTQLVVTAPATPKPTAPPRVIVSASPMPLASAAPTQTPVATPTRSPSATASLTPAGVDTVTPGPERSLAPDADSLDALVGRVRSNDAPWTRALWWLLIAAIPIVGAAAFALARDRRRAGER